MPLQPISPHGMAWVDRALDFCSIAPLFQMEVEPAKKPRRIADWVLALPVLRLEVNGALGLR